jgi:2-phosphosulfolactate phosphatase
MAVAAGAAEIITGAFSNLSAVCHHLIDRGKPVVLACAAWKDRVNLEDTLFAGAVVNQLAGTFDIPCDASKIAASLFKEAQPDLFEFMKSRNASHYRRLMGFGLERDIRHCLTPDTAPVLPIFREEKLLKRVD